MAMTVLAAYDVSHNDRRARLAALLQAYGERIQKSVFLLAVDEDEMATVDRRAQALIDLDTDSLWFSPFCSTCWDRRRMIGQARAPEKTLYWAVL